MKNVKFIAIGWCIVFAVAIAEERVKVYEDPSLQTNKVLEVIWQPQCHLNVDVNGKGNVVYDTGEDGWYAAGQIVVLEAKPQPYYYFDKWEGNADLTNPSANPLEVVIDKPLNIVAVFKPCLSSRGTPCEWYVSKGITENLENADDADHDGDGIKGREEYLWGSDPMNPKSFPKVEILNGDGSNKIVRIREAAKGRVYRVYSNTSLKPGRWVEKVSVNPDLDGDFEIEIQGNVQMEFYRVRAEVSE